MQAVTETIRQPPKVVLPEDGELSYLPVANIAPKNGHNPRRYFSPHAMAELVASVRAQGVLQPIVVRALGEDRYEIIAGERRWRAACMANLDEIPAVIREVDARQAVEIALIENTHRADLAPSEEAQKAREFVTLCDGDHAEAAKRLGWSDSKLRSRLALLSCTPAVLQALDTRAITLGHGELLATLPTETQDGTLPRLIEGNIPVAALRERIQGIARSLGAALFALDGCGACPHNSTVQGSLFDAHIAAGNCSNPACYHAKTLEALEARKADLAERFAAVWLDTERAPGTYAVLEQQGPQGVGPQQYAEGCRQCGQFGALLGTTPGQEGRVTEDVCFDGTCRADKQAAYKALVATPAPAVAAPAKTPVKTGKGGAAVSECHEAPAKAAKVGETPKKVEEVLDGKLRSAAAGIAAEDPRVARAVRLYALWRDSQWAQVPLAPASLGRAQTMAWLIALNEADCAALEAALVESILTRDDLERTEAAAAVIATTATPLAGRVRVDAELLQAHRKSGMDALLRQAGFAAWLDAQKGKGAYAKLAAGRIADTVTAATDPAGFDWSTFVPPGAAERVKKLAWTHAK